eukprot:7123373-Alexandrium_andersonii.AAC.1
MCIRDRRNPRLPRRQHVPPGGPCASARAAHLPGSHAARAHFRGRVQALSLIHISEPTRLALI